MVRNESEVSRRCDACRAAQGPGHGRAGAASTTIFVTLLAVALVCVLSAGCGAPEPATGEEDTAATPDWGQAQGRWHGHGWLEVPLEEERSLTAEQRMEFARLRSLGYLPGSSPVPVNTGVVVYDGRRTSDGLNFYTSGHIAGAVLMDMAGNRLHKWRMDFADAWAAQPGDDPPDSIKGAGYWRRAHLFENGDVLAIFEGLGLIKVDKHSNLLWARFGGFHHDMDVTDDGLIYVLTRKPRIIPAIHQTLPVLEDFVAVLDAEGNELRRVSVLEALESSDVPGLLDGLGEHGDILHTNTVEVLDGRLAGNIPAFAAGNVLICIRELSVIAVLDLELGKAVWGMDGRWGKPHQPTVLDNGNLLIFDNRGNAGRSQVIEFDPVTARSVWTHRGETPEDFYSWECGSNQRLENGSTLITESDRGKAFEVTPDGTIVWKYLNPMRAGDELEFIATIFELGRLPKDFPLGWLDETGGRRR
ncbi:MAG: arylsulfotransferase family protein [Candidatus Eisenbacteria bacterium]|nr:arylsulfotransferase family protein [Candidatus Eisenbacteria bacterium]